MSPMTYHEERSWCLMNDENKRRFRFEHSGVDIVRKNEREIATGVFMAEAESGTVISDREYKATIMLPWARLCWISDGWHVEALSDHDNPEHLHFPAKLFLSGCPVVIEERMVG